MKAIARDHLKRWTEAGHDAARVYKISNHRMRVIRLWQLQQESKLAAWATMCELTVFMGEKS